MITVLKKVYRFVALLALIHVVAIGGVAGFLLLTGRVTPDRVKAAVDALRGMDADPVAVKGDVPPSAKKRDGKPASGAVVDADAREVQRLELQRIRMHAQQQLILAKRQMIQVQREREAFEKQVAQFKAARDAERREVRSEAFDKELEIVSQLKPKIALDRLLLLPIDEASQLLMRMDTRKSRRIIEAAHRQPQKWSQMMQIQERMGQLGPASDDERASRATPAGASS